MINGGGGGKKIKIQTITATVKDKGEKDVEGSNRGPFLDNIL